MLKYKVEILSPAAKDIERIAEYYLRMVGSLSAEKITDKLLDTIQTLEDNPFAGMEHPDTILYKQNYRKIIAGEYICVYKIIEKRVFIYRVVHGATDYPKLFGKE
ncbi:MAG: type II toxin-antitoxin system RelE/ParE family toxin [Spirochaetales bacterium]|nr:type II toxin-antitoxin system RelE/ParE family toxin [Spirochaetales bacterium]